MTQACPLRLSPSHPVHHGDRHPKNIGGGRGCPRVLPTPGAGWSRGHGEPEGPGQGHAAVGGGAGRPSASSRQPAGLNLAAMHFLQRPSPCSKGGPVPRAGTKQEQPRYW